MVVIKKLSVEEQHEAYVNEIKDLKKEVEELRSLILKITFQSSGITSSFLKRNSLKEWVYIDKTN